jgi:hypothetical protein
MVYLPYYKNGLITLYCIGNVEVKIHHIINGLITLYCIGNVEVKIHHIINSLITLYYFNLYISNTIQCN